MRNRAAAAAAAAAAAMVAALVAASVVFLLLTPSTARAATVGEDTLAVDPPAAVGDGTVTVSGSCAGVSDGVDSSFPTRTELRLSGVLIGDDVPLRSGRFGPLRVSVPGNLDPQEHELTSTCGLPEPVAVVPFTVLPAPLLTVTPESVEPGEDITVTGTCRLPSREPVEISLGNQRPLGTATLDGATGVLEPLTVPVPADADPREDVVVSSCGARDVLTIRAPDPPADETTPPTDETTPPTDETVPPTDETVPPTDETVPPTDETVPPTDRTDLIVVPNLFDLTEEEALLALGDDLVLDVVVGSDGRVTRQEPQPGELVTRGSTVGVNLGAPPPPDGSWWQVLAAAVLVLAALVAAIAASARTVRQRRQRRWIDGHVVAVPTPGAWVMRPGPDRVGPSVDMRIEVRRDPPGLEFEEVGHARD